jgi:hypothetical protein
MWTDEEKCNSSTWRELKSVQSCLEAFKKQLFGKSVKCILIAKTVNLLFRVVV